jgi:Protein of unknown function (DUF1592)/Protein of unknown function (DUF1588)/Protein of unknown function (DUF1595)/Protein of unknown function (DUF1587)/Protein of unknown function (DUF1585)
MTTTYRRTCFVFLLGILGCTGNITPDTQGGAGNGNTAATGGNNSGTGGNSAAMCNSSITPGPSPMRRLTRWEYNNTVADLLGDASQPALAFVPEAVQLGFDNNADGATLSAVLISQQDDAAGRLAGAAVAKLSTLLGCDSAAKGEEVCATEFIARFGRRALRHTLDATERARYLAFYKQERATGTYAETIEQIVHAMLLSPYFLYRPEFGSITLDTKAARPLSAHELASRLSYLFWGSMPDDVLLDAADADKLSTPKELQIHAERLLSHARGQNSIKNFYGQWASLSQLASTTRDKIYTPQIAALQQQETEAFVDDIVRAGDGRWATMLTAPLSFQIDTLAAFYGSPGGTKELTRVALDPKRHSGLLTQGSLMTLLAHPGQTSPVLRGKFLLDRVLCLPPPPPPDDVDTTVPAPDPNVSARKQLEQKTQTVSPCMGCHAMINPPGFAFDHFDAMGRWRDTEDNKIAIDASGELLGTDVDGPFTDHVGLAKLLAESKTSRECVVTEWFRYAYGRDHDAVDNCTVDELRASFETSKGDIRQLLLSLAQTEAFRYLPASSEVGP